MLSHTSSRCVILSRAGPPFQSPFPLPGKQVLEPEAGLDGGVAVALFLAQGPCSAFFDGVVCSLSPSEKWNRPVASAVKTVVLFGVGSFPFRREEVP